MAAADFHLSERRDAPRYLPYPGGNLMGFLGYQGWNETWEQFNR